MQENNIENNKIVWAFFGTSRFSVIVLETLKACGLVPTLIVTTEDKPQGRKLVLTPPPVKVWAEKEKIPYIQPKTLRQKEGVPDVKKIIESYSPSGFDVFVVASYGKILPQDVIDMPRRHTLNIHPSLLPKLRGASPLQSAILTEDETGVTIIRIDAEMDHGLILAQEKVDLPDWPVYFEDAEEILAKAGAEILARILPDWMQNKVPEIVQDHSKATLCGKIEKSDAELNLAEPAETNLRKIRAYHEWPGAYFFHTRSHGEKTRIIVKRARVEDGRLVIERIVPEGKKEMNYADFMRSNA